ncbi:hypothetical protein OF376_02350 [Ureaplasma miroungigenitalium]|uniref:YqaJ viral recombinase domain-containing protein n=1 Tax=Ureaplasma miroungigenitalium TaxID=1042321 RepID=A0ABT3BN02_9BACT|nr:hypothetical protein [Ureaplasma miroungigenitalium]MCV3728604.1 hypothetical protein [Ureaplasma miroungigenitalium]MCV3734389.1 hypothetical protein [Ureaplasma miroungigenitalium]
MPFIKKYNQDFTLKDDRIILNKKYYNDHHKNFKKITGSRLGEILGVGEYASPVKAWCAMVGIYREEIDPIHANAGNVIERKVFDLVNANTDYQFVAYNPKDIGFDAFKENSVFGGIPDGEPINEQGEIDYSKGPMLEIKTSSIDKFLYEMVDEIPVLRKDENNRPIVKTPNEKYLSWFNADKEIQIPVNYQLQLGLYLYLRKQTHGLFAVTFLTTDDYMNPNAYDPKTHEIFLANFQVDLQQFEQQIYTPAKQWYEDYIVNGFSPKLTPRDKRWFEVWKDK